MIYFVKAYKFSEDLRNAFEHHMSVERECVEFLRDRVDDLREAAKHVNMPSHQTTKKTVVQMKAVIKE